MSWFKEVHCSMSKVTCEMWKQANKNYTAGKHFIAMSFSDILGGYLLIQLINLWLLLLL